MTGMDAVLPEFLKIAGSEMPEYKQKFLSVWKESPAAVEAEACFEYIPSACGGFYKAARTVLKSAEAFIPLALNRIRIEEIEEQASREAYPEPADDAEDLACEYLDSLEPTPQQLTQIHAIAEKLIFDLGLSTHAAFGIVLVSDYWYDSIEFYEEEDGFSHEQCQDALFDALGAAVYARSKPRAESYLKRNEELLERYVTLETKDFPAIENDHPKSLPFGIKKFSDVSPDITRPGLVKGLLNEACLAAIYGAPNTAKTFIALKLGWCIASDTAFFGLKVSQGPVFYCFTEGGHSGEKRIQAMRTLLGKVDSPLYISNDPINLADPDSVNRFISTLKLIKAKLGIIDTFARSANGLDENSAQDMGRIIQAVDRIRMETGAAIILVHHTGKDSDRGMRGSSAFLGAVDTTLEVVTDPKTLTRKLQSRKQRDFDTGQEIAFRLEDVFLGHDADGDPVKSAVAVEDHSSAVAAFSKPVLKYGSPEFNAFEVLKDLCGSEGIDRHGDAPSTFGPLKWVAEGKWRESFLAKYYSETASRSTKADAFSKAKSRLANGRYIQIEGGRVGCEWA